MQRHGRTGPTQGEAQEDDPPHGTGRITELSEIQRDPAFEQDNSHCQGNHGTQIATEAGLRIKQRRTGSQRDSRPQDQTGPHHQHDGWPAQAPGEPLGGNT